MAQTGHDFPCIALPRANANVDRLQEGALSIISQMTYYVITPRLGRLAAIVCGLTKDLWSSRSRGSSHRYARRHLEEPYTGPAIGL